MKAVVSEHTLSFEMDSMIFAFAVGLITGLRNTATKSRLVLQTFCNHFISAYTASTWFCSVARSSKLFAYLPAKRGFFICLYFAYCLLIKLHFLRQLLN